MRNILLTITYEGSAYHGWQVQENALTVQQALQDALESLFGSRPAVTGCSRTDTGVHASMFCCNFRANSSLECERIMAALNHFLPEDIAVNGCREVPWGFHARYDCLGKRYKYLIWNGPVRNPFYINRAFHYRYPLDENMLDEAARQFIGTFDFSAFCASGSSTLSKTRTISHAEVRRKGDIVEFTVEGDGFLYNMVRIMAGTLIYIAEGRIDKSGIGDIIKSGDRSRAGFTAPAEGLYLDEVSY